LCLALPLGAFVGLCFGVISKRIHTRIVERSRLQMDDAGLRVDTSEEQLYASWAAITKIEVVTSRVDGVRWLVLSIVGRRAVEIPLITDQAERSATALAYIRRPSLKRTDEGLLGELKRSADLSQWAREMRQCLESD
jgi:hypothetical protein